MYLTGIKKQNNEHSGFPFSIAAIAHFSELQLRSPVAFFVGANASGKSTLLESLAIASNRVVIGGTDLDQDQSLDDVRPLARSLELVWTKKTSKGFFFRAEDFFNFIRKNRELGQEMQEYAERYENNLFAKQAMLGQKRALEARYGKLEHQSHGEGFLQVFKSRIVSGGMYLLDEPEAALSPLSQLALMYQMKDMLSGGEKAQFIIATHSPLLMSYPGAQIFCFDDDRIHEVEYDDVGHVDLYRRFLADPGRYLNRLFAD